MQKLRVYLDTSVFSAYHDDRTPERQAETRRFWARLGAFEVGTSEVAKQEAAGTPDLQRRQLILALVESVAVFPVEAEERAIADRLNEAGAVPPGEGDDAVHIAAALAGGYDVLASWNFRHIVNLRARSAIARVVRDLGLKPLEVVSPSEM